jgi:hypothetical protein
VRTHRFLVYFLLLFSTLRAQTSLNKSSQAGLAFVYHNDSIKRLDFQTGTISFLSQNEWSSCGTLPELPELFREHAHPQPTVIQTLDTTLISFSGSGVVYTIKKNGSVERHDRTYFSGYNFGALKYFNGTTLWSLGGYGLWRVTDHALYYDPALREWDRQIMSPNIIEGFGDGFYSALAPNKLRMVVSSRTEFNGADVVNSVYEVDLTKHTYRYIGSPKHNLDLFNNQDQLGFSAANNGWNIVFEGNKTLLANLAENKLYQTKINSTQSRPFDGMCGILVHPRGVLLIETASTATNQHVKIVRTTMDELIKQPDNIDLGAIFEPTWIAQIRSNVKLILSIILSVGGLAALIVRYQRARPVAEQTYANALSSAQRIVFRHLMLLPPDQSITTNELNSLLSLEDKTWDNQRKIRSTVLQEIEEKGLQFLGVPSFIERISSEDDRRIRRYRIKPELRDDLTSVLKYV